MRAPEQVADDVGQLAHHTTVGVVHTDDLDHVIRVGGCTTTSTAGTRSLAC